MNKPLKGDAVRRIGAIAEMFKVRAVDTPTNKVIINEGTLLYQNITPLQFPTTVTEVINPPASNAQWIVVTITNTGLISILRGASAVSPDFPVIPKNRLPLAAIYMEYDDVVITNDMIYDVRSFITFGYPETDHQELLNRHGDSRHTVADIESLQTELDNRLTNAELTSILNNNLVTKADVTGTSETVFTLNANATGTVTENSAIMINRGSAIDVGIRWNETSDIFEITQDGSTWIPLLDTPETLLKASDAQLGITKLSAAPADSNNPIAVGDNDTRMLTDQQKTDLLAHEAIVAGNPHAVTSTEVGLGNVTNVEQLPLSYLEQTLTDDAAKVLSSAGILDYIQTNVLNSGTTVGRPTPTIVGFTYFDTDLGYPVFWNGSAFVDATGTPA